ncbi:MAG: hypothetical protein GF416_09510 [Candidatus Altiarchaeales archaeon]|nr:hypothetical protein [Candidatus Altiarchaeales archaeon]MBD3417356.1 hypothetical protein [Candidatus Altiarchaeales archaeon]
MTSESRFFKRARAVVDHVKRLKGLRNDGKLGEAEYSEKVKRLSAEMLVLRDEHIKLLESKISSADLAIGGLEGQRDSGVLSSDEFHRLKRKLSMERRELDSELDMLQLCDSEEYASYLRKQVEADALNKRFEWTDGLEMYGKAVGSSDTDSPPRWAAAVVLAMVGLSVLAAVASGKEHALVLFPSFTLALIVLYSYLLHASTYLAGLDLASVGRALTCLMMTALMSTAIMSVVLLISAVVLSITFSTSLPGAFTSEVLKASYLNLLEVVCLVVVLVVFVFSVHEVYHTTLWASVLTVIVHCILSVLAALSMFLLFLSLPEEVFILLL